MMTKHAARGETLKHCNTTDPGRGGVRYIFAIFLLSLIGSTAFLPDISALMSQHTRAEDAPRSVLVSAAVSVSPMATMPMEVNLPPPTAISLSTAASSVSPPAPANPTPTAIANFPILVTLGPVPTLDQGKSGSAVSVNGGIQVPVLMYHYIRVNPVPSDQLGAGLSVTPLDFAAQMEWLVTHGYHTVFASDILHAFTSGASLPTKPIVLTFDDGYRDFYSEARPVLQRYGLKATIAISTAFADKGDAGDGQYMSWDMVRALDQSKMVEIASHTISHVDLTQVTATQRMNEITQSKRILESKLNHPCQTFVYPSGLFNSAVVTDAARVGYRIAFTTQSGKVRIPVDSGRLLLLPRVRVSGGESLTAFAKDLG